MANQVSHVMADLEMNLKEYFLSSFHTFFSSCKGLIFSLSICSWYFNPVALSFYSCCQWVFGVTEDSFWWHPSLCSQRPGALDTVRRRLRILWQTLRRRSGWKHCWRLQDSSALGMMHHRVWSPA